MGRALEKEVVVVEKDENVRKLFSDIISFLTPTKVKKLEDGVEAKHYIEKNMGRISLVLIEGILPGMNGDKVIRELLRKGCYDIPFVLTSGLDSSYFDNSIFKYKNISFLKKPFDLDTIESIVKKYAL